MDDVTDVVFREMICSTTKPDVFFTEFTNVDGLNSKGKLKLMPRLMFKPTEHPIVAQIWGRDLENYTKTSQMLVKMGFDGIDINMGCPERNVIKNGNCSGLIREPERAKAIIQATKKGAAGKIPVSVKTRLGFDKPDLSWIKFLLEQDIDCLTIHGRTAREMSKVPAHWELIAEVVKLRDQISPNTLIVGNGDIESYAEALEKAKQSAVDGVMIGRGIFRNMFVFDPSGKSHSDLSMDDRLELLIRHVRLFEQTWGQTKNFNILKKFFKIYISDFDGASDLRVRLMETASLLEVEQVVTAFRVS